MTFALSFHCLPFSWFVNFLAIIRLMVKVRCFRVLLPLEFQAVY